MKAITLQAVPSQTFNVSLGGQTCNIKLYTRSTGLYIDLTANNVVIMTGVLCLNNLRLVRETYLGFVGDLVFTDTQGSQDPDYTGLDDRYQFIYLEASDL